MKTPFLLSLCLAGALLTSCRSPQHALPSESAASVLQKMKARFAPDGHLGIYSVGLELHGSQLILTGEVDRAEARLETRESLRRAGLRPVDQVRVLPAPDLGDKTWGLSILSVATGREQPEHKAEMGTQVLLGNPVRIWKQTTNAWLQWFYVQSEDGYLSWVEEGTILPCTKAELDSWQASPLLIVTAFDDRILEQPQPQAQPVSDVVLADLVKQIGESGTYYEVQLPDGRHGFLPKASAQSYRDWKSRRHPVADAIEQTSRTLLGRPYLWGGNSPKGLDCSGFTKTVFFLNGIDLKRNASHQAQQGQPVPLDALKKGDLLFFGTPARDGKPERIRHVGIYLGNELFIHSSERVRISSLDPASPIRDENRIRTLLRARRILPE